MLSDGTNAFSWNARNQVATLNSVSLQYDAFGRRTLNTAGKSFLYDGANAAQELFGSTVLANLQSGGVDEVFTRADSAGSFTQLKDALGSTIALVNASGNVVTYYSYDPFGNTTLSGATNGNEFQYTGRENEGNGLYYYRARFYSPLLGRFISQDPLGFAGSGPNLYAYAGDAPTNYTDPFGLQTTTSGTVTTPYQGDPSPAEIQKAIQSQEAIESGASGGSTFLPQTVGEAGLAGGLVVLDSYLAYQDYDAIKVFNAENKTYADELHSVAVSNAANIAHPSAPYLLYHSPALAGRYNGGKPLSAGGGDDDDECKEEWKKAGDFCSQLDDLRSNDPIEFRKWKNIFGPNILSCMNGQVSERCGGHKT